MTIRSLFIHGPFLSLFAMLAACQPPMPPPSSDSGQTSDASDAARSAALNPIDFRIGLVAAPAGWRLRIQGAAVNPRSSLACTSTLVDGCRVRICQRDTEYLSLDSWTPLSFGTVTVSARHTVTASPEESGTYSPFLSGRETFFEPGDLVRVQADGTATLPAFNTTLRAPSRLQSFSAEGPWRRGEDFVVRWDPAGGAADERIGIYIFGRDLPEEAFQYEAREITCTASRSMGRATVPGSVTALIPAGFVGGGFAVYGTAVAEMSVGGVPTTIAVDAVNATFSQALSF